MRVDVVETADAGDESLVSIRYLLDSAFGGDFSDSDWHHTIGGTHVVAYDDGALVGHASVIARHLTIGDEHFDAGYVEGVATQPQLQGTGIGTAIMTEIGRIIVDRFAIGALSTGEHVFYERLGWRRWLGPTGVSSAGVVRRTEEDDDSVMVLLFGRHAGIDRKSQITCEARVGDDW